MNEILQIKNLKVSYGPISAVKGIDLSVERGKLVALLGANGAGKTSTLRAISGLTKASGGEILLDGVNIANEKPYKIAKAGVMQSPEGRMILSGLTVEENLKAGAYSLKPKSVNGNRLSVRVQMAANFERVYALFPRLKERARQQSNTLSGGEQQMLAIGRALMASPKVLLLDEPSLGLAPLVIKDIFAVLTQIKKEGTTILIVEQNALASLKIADYAYVLELGRITMHGPADELRRDERLIEAYLGGKTSD
ncbi:MAG: ABC transporter ATP-binding protein [Clostridia bacterium]|nr:ABC transporter ATP-binding protein [Clostridia bacterium]